MKYSAGILFYKIDPFQVLLVHPSGNYNKNAKWSIPKGNRENNENVLETAFREISEELGVNLSGKEEYINLDYVTYQSGKKEIYVLAMNFSVIQNQTLKLNWENDKYEFYSYDEAEKIIHPDQFVFIKRLQKELLENAFDSLILNVAKKQGLL